METEPTKHQKFKIGDKVEIIYANNPEYIGLRFIISENPKWITLLYKEFGAITDWYYNTGEIKIKNRNNEIIESKQLCAERFLRKVNDPSELEAKITKEVRAQNANA